jgi:hypothetical protein
LQSSLPLEDVDLLSSILVTLCGDDSSFVVKKIMKKIMIALGSCHLYVITDNLSWKEICVGLRFLLFTSFRDCFKIRKILPELFHILTSCFGLGNTVTRRTVHAIVINILQQLCCECRDSSRRSKVEVSILKFEGDAMKTHMGLSGKTGSHSYEMPSFSTKEDNTHVVSTIDVSGIENFVSFLSQLTSLILSGTDEIAARAQWRDLAVVYAFGEKKSLQSASLVSLGVLLQNSYEKHLLVKVVNQMKSSMTFFEETRVNTLAACLSCLDNLIPSVQKSIPVLSSLFWMTVTMAEFANLTIFEKVLQLLRSILDQFGDLQIYGQDLQNLLMNGLKKSGNSNVNYHDHLSVSLSAVLMKGLAIPSLRKKTCLVLISLFTLACGGVGSKVQWEKDNAQVTFIMGFAIPLVPLFETGEVNFPSDADFAAAKENALARLAERFILQNGDEMFVQQFMVSRMIAESKSDAGYNSFVKFLTFIADISPKHVELMSGILTNQMLQFLPKSKSSMTHMCIHNFLNAIATCVAPSGEQTNQMLKERCLLILKRTELTYEESVLLSFAEAASRLIEALE